MAGRTAWSGLITPISSSRVELGFPLFGRSRVGPSWTTHCRRLPLHLLYFVVDGAIAGQIDGKPVHLPSGTFLWMPPLVEHHLLMPRRESHFTTYFVRIETKKLPSPSQSLVVQYAWDISPLVEQLLDELRGEFPWSNIMRRSLLAQMLVRALRRQARPSGDAALSAGQRGAILRYVEQRLHERPTPTDLASLLDLSPDYFSRLFRKTFGRSPREWLAHERMRHAAGRLVESTESIKQIAYSLGFADLYLFSRQFKRFLGQSPRSYRRAMTTGK